LVDEFCMVVGTGRLFLLTAAELFSPADSSPADDFRASFLAVSLQQCAHPSPPRVYDPAASSSEANEQPMTALDYASDVALC
jgi:hypothetical protein